MTDNHALPQIPSILNANLLFKKRYENHKSMWLEQTVDFLTTGCASGNKLLFPEKPKLLLTANDFLKNGFLSVSAL